MNASAGDDAAGSGANSALTEFRAYLRDLWASFWLLPTAVLAAFVATSLGLIELERTIGQDAVEIGFTGDAGAARGILSTIATSLITVAGLSLSIMILTLQMVSAQFNPRSVRGLLANRITQITAGCFIGIFAFCLIALRAVRSSSEGGVEFVPALTVSAAMVLAVASLILLLFFFHQVGSSIQISTITARIARETLRSIDTHRPPGSRADAPEHGADRAASWREKAEPVIVRSESPGYLRRIIPRRLLSKLPSGSRVLVIARPGDFFTAADSLAEIWIESGEVEEASAREAFQIADERDVVDDFAFGLRQLTDIAARSLATGVDDTTTAVTCIGYLRACLERLATRPAPPALSTRERGVEVFARQRDFGELLENSLVELGPSCSRFPHVVANLVEALAAIAAAAHGANFPSHVAAVKKAGDALVGMTLAEVPAHQRPAIESAHEQLSRVGQGIPSLG